MTCGELKAHHEVGDGSPDDGLDKDVGYFHIALGTRVWEAGIHACKKWV